MGIPHVYPFVHTDLDDAQITTEEGIAFYLFDELDIGEQSAADAGRRALRIVLNSLSVDEFAELKGA